MCLAQLLHLKPVLSWKVPSTLRKYWSTAAKVLEYFLGSTESSSHWLNKEPCVFGFNPLKKFFRENRINLFKSSLKRFQTHFRLDDF